MKKNKDINAYKCSVDASFIYDDTLSDSAKIIALRVLISSYLMDGKIHSTPEDVANINTDRINFSMTKKVEKKEKSCCSDAGIRFANWFAGMLKQEVALDRLIKWGQVYDTLSNPEGKFRLSNIQIANLCNFALTDEFWKNQFRSPAKLLDTSKTLHDKYVWIFHRKVGELSMSRR